MAIQNIGRVSIVAKGTYIASETYEKLDLVVFNDASYLCRKTCSGIEPIAGTVTDYWQPFADSIEILATKEEVEANTDSGKVADALVVKGLSAEVTELNCGLSQLNGDLNQFLIVIDLAKQYSVEPFSNTNFTISDIIQKEGYTPLGIVGYAMNSPLAPSNLRLLGNEWDVYIRNNLDYKIESWLNFHVLYMKNR